MPSVPVIHSPRYACDIGPHVFPTVKYAFVIDRLAGAGLVRREDVIEPGEPSRELLLRAHTPEFLDDLDELRWTPRTMPSELPLTSEITTAYRLATSGTAIGARMALEQGMAVHVGGGFHHAYADHAEGFCYLNDLAVAIRAMQAEGRIRRAAVVDLDVHQGNGTAGILGRDPDVFTLSFHQENNYPVPKTPGTLDVGFADGTGDDEYLSRLDDVLPRVWDFAPELLLYQAGADPYAEDQLGGLRLSIAGLERRDRAVLEGAASRGIPAVVTFGGGYARRLEDTVTIHAATCRVAIEAAARGPVRAGRSPGAPA